MLTNRHYEYDPHASSAPRQVDFASGCCLGISREVFEKVGLLDESFFVYWEDTDFCMRLKENRIPIFYVPEPSLLHAVSAASGGEFTLAYTRLYCRSYMQFVRKHFGTRRAVATMLRLVLLERKLFRRNHRRIRLVAGSLLRGLATPLVPEARLR
ncbi:MAG: glycosyltransferase family 2 protein [Alphaproteobacteria bacterium]|nr:glycosyltransferase family 2 protein [Alphaproteobacteria bacterium]